VKRQFAKWQLASVERAIIKCVMVIEKYEIKEKLAIGKITVGNVFNGQL